jgi:hypothetical protein
VIGAVGGFWIVSSVPIRKAQADAGRPGKWDNLPDQHPGTENATELIKPRCEVPDLDCGTVAVSQGRFEDSKVVAIALL